MKRTTVVQLCLCLLFAFTGRLYGQERIAGSWEGAISLPGLDLGISVHFRGEGDSLRATIDIPMQGAMGLALTNVRAALPAVHFELPAGPGLAVFEGVAAGDTIKGDFRQGGVAAKFHLHRLPGPTLPGVVTPPPYREEEVRISAEAVSLAGTLSMPEEGAPFPAVILITGSGAQNRDEEIMGFAPFKILADHLTRSGFAVLRCDDRGVGGSTGDMASSTTAEFAKDAGAMFRFLQGRPEIRRSKIGLLGHSEGAEVAGMLAARSNDVAFVVLLAGPAIPGDSLILSQIRLIMRAQGATDEDMRNALALQRRVFETVRRQQGWDGLQAELLAEMRRSFDNLPADQQAAITNRDSLIASRTEIQMKAVRSPWFAFFTSYDPAVDLANVRCPVLSLFGELDQQVPPSLNLEPMKKALLKNGNPDVSVQTIPGANHLFQKAVTGSPMEYAGLEKKFADGVLDLITEWLKKRTR